MPKATTPNALIAAATRVTLRDPKLAVKQMAKRQDWHAEAFGYFDEVPEIKEGIRYRGNQLGKLKLFVAAPNPKNPDGEMIPAMDPASGVPAAVAGAAEAELGRLRSVMGGQSELLRMLDMNWELVGDCYLVGFAARDEVRDPLDPMKVLSEAQPENWMIHSVSEVQIKGTGPTAKTSILADENDKAGRVLDPEMDTIIRLYLRHPQWANKADCSMRGLLGECRVLQVLSQQLLAHAYRALSAGFFTVPNELSFTPLQPGTPGEATVDPLTAVLDEVLSGPVEDPTAPSTVQPGLLRGPAEYLKPDVLRLIRFYDPDVVRDIESRIEARVRRIARGMSIPVEKILGFQQTTYANADQIDQDEFEDFFRPSADASMDALTYAFLQPQLLEAGGQVAAWADRLRIWYDPSDLIAQPDAESHAVEAHDRNAISNAALRKALGFGEDDAPEPLELLIKAGLRRGILTADLTLALLNLLGVPIDVPEGGTADPTGQTTDQMAATAQLMALLSGGRPTLAAASRPAPTVDYGRRLTDIDRDLRTRLLVSANAAMGAALTRAANRLRTRTNGTDVRASLSTVPRRDWFAHLGPSIVADVMGDEDPLSGAWVELESDFMAWGAASQAEARSVAGAATGRDQSDLEERQSDDLSNAWAWLAAALSALAVARMWNPDPAAPEVGEHDPSLMVPAGLIRQAIARAGGAQGLTTGGTGEWVVLTDGGTRPAGGIGTGEVIRGALRDGGAQVEGYVWEYGPAYRARPFEEHQALDGTFAANFDSDQWSGGGWTGFGYWMPGDHDGCRCDARPVVLPVGEAD